MVSGGNAKVDGQPAQQLYIKHLAIISGGRRPASTRVASPYGGPVFTGKPRIRLAPPRFGFSRSPLPALCRRATSCAWRSRLRKIPDRRSGCSHGSRGKVRKSSWGDVGAQTDARQGRSEVPGPIWWSKWPRGWSKRPNRIERPRAPNVTHSVVRRTCVSETM